MAAIDARITVRGDFISRGRGREVGGWGEARRAREAGKSRRGGESQLRDAKAAEVNERKVQKKEQVGGQRGRAAGVFG